MPSNIRIKNIRAQHAERKIKWTRARVDRLCSILSITETELIAYLDWSRRSFRLAYRSNTFPGYICIVLDLYEAYAYKTILGEQVNFDLPFPTEMT